MPWIIPIIQECSNSKNEKVSAEARLFLNEFAIRNKIDLDADECNYLLFK